MFTRRVGLDANVGYDHNRSAKHSLLLCVFRPLPLSGPRFLVIRIESANEGQPTQR
jgi:hypothetical protein